MPFIVNEFEGVFAILGDIKLWRGLFLDVKLSGDLDIFFKN